MNPFELDATGLMVWGLVAHLIADWPLQNDWMANNKARRRHYPQPFESSEGFPCETVGAAWWDRHPAAHVHAGIHGALLAFVFGWVAAPLALAHLVIDLRFPVAWWSSLIRQTQPIKPVWAFRHGWKGHVTGLRDEAKRGPLSDHGTESPGNRESQAVLVDVGLEVRFWTDQVFHIACIAVAALAVAA